MSHTNRETGSTNEHAQGADVPNFTLLPTNKIIAAFHAKFVIQFICSLQLIAALNGSGLSSWILPKIFSANTHKHTRWSTDQQHEAWTEETSHKLHTPNRSNTKHSKPKQLHMIHTDAKTKADLLKQT